MEEGWNWAEREVRRRWRTLSAFRLGLVVGENGLEVCPPDGKSAKWRRLFEAGVKSGRETTARATPPR